MTHVCACSAGAGTAVALLVVKSDEAWERTAGVSDRLGRMTEMASPLDKGPVAPAALNRITRNKAM
jgi:hypothetical protein